MLGLNNVEFFACLPYIIQIPINMKLYDPFLYIIKKVAAKKVKICSFSSQKVVKWPLYVLVLIELRKLFFPSAQDYPI